MPITPRRQRTPRRGAILMLVAVLMPVFVMMVAFAIDVAWMQLVRTELRTATDASSRAGAKILSLRQDQDLAREAAIEAASRNPVAGVGLTVTAANVEFGQSTQATPESRFQFSPNVTPVNAVRVAGSRGVSSADGDVELFFGSVLGTPAFQPSLTATSSVLDRDICLVIDRSGSMGLNINFSGTGNGQNCGPMRQDSRFFALAQAVQAFLQELDATIPVERVALASYSTSVFRNCSNGAFQYPAASIDNELTPTYDEITGSMNDFVQRGIGGGTSIGLGLREGIEALEDARPLAAKTIVLMTDGRHNRGVTPENVAPEAVAADVTVHTVTFSPNADIARMQTVADLTGGRHFHADTAVDLALIFREIARTLPVLVTE